MNHPVKAIQHIVIDTTGAYTPLCYIGKLTGTDKSPYGEHNGHLHPYTGVYSMLFGPLRFREIQFAEIGVAGGASAALWYNYFGKETAKLCFFDRDQNFLNNLDRMPEPKPFKALMDVNVDGDVARALSLPGGQYDVILDDSSHEFDHQIRIIKEGFPLVKPGGYLIIEDVYRSRPEIDYENAIRDILPQCAEAYFVVCNHEERYSPGWNNDKILVLVKGA